MQRTPHDAGKMLLDASSSGPDLQLTRQTDCEMQPKQLSEVVAAAEAS